MKQEVQPKDNNPPTNQKVETQTAPTPSVASLPLPPFDPNSPIGQFPHTTYHVLGTLVRVLTLTSTVDQVSDPVLMVVSGVEHVRLGYYCRVCLLFYSNEDTAKKRHCSSQAHYEKLQVSAAAPPTGAWAPPADAGVPPTGGTGPAHCGTAPPTAFLCFRNIWKRKEASLRR